MKTINCYKAMQTKPTNFSHQTFNPLKVTMSGMVKNEFGDALQGVNVRLQNNPTIGAATDKNGNFLINNVEDGALVVVSHLGYQTVIFDVNTSLTNFYPIEMKIEINDLPEVVVNAPKAKNKNWLWAIAAAFGIYALASVSDDKTQKKGLNAPNKKQPVKAKI